MPIIMPTITPAKNNINIPSIKGIELRAKNPKVIAAVAITMLKSELPKG